MNISEQELVFAIGCMQASSKGIFFFFWRSEGLKFGVLNLVLESGPGPST